MSIEERVLELEKQLVLQHDVVTREVARFRALEVELALLRSRSPDASLLVLQPRSDAIVTVLRLAGVSLSPREVVGLLREAGRDDSLKVVTATLSYLLGRGVVVRPERGRYLVV